MLYIDDYPANSFLVGDQEEAGQKAKGQEEEENKRGQKTEEIQRFVKRRKGRKAWGEGKAWGQRTWEASKGSETETYQPSKQGTMLRSDWSRS